MYVGDGVKVTDEEGEKVEVGVYVDDAVYVGEGVNVAVAVYVGEGVKLGDVVNVDDGVKLGDLDGVQLELRDSDTVADREILRLGDKLVLEVRLHVCEGESEALLESEALWADVGTDNTKAHASIGKRARVTNTFGLKSKVHPERGFADRKRGAHGSGVSTFESWEHPNLLHRARGSRIQMKAR